MVLMVVIFLTDCEGEMWGQVGLRMWGWDWVLGGEWGDFGLMFGEKCFCGIWIDRDSRQECVEENKKGEDGRVCLGGEYFGKGFWKGGKHEVWKGNLWLVCGTWD
ncbi:uncharacterized protein MONOS_18370 [Monocercomonoides exilis]|uniref:uncharacterized protein n=1 Tax=Monocercomonoides exilis TaxID=2049356 RepID=UPI003559D7BF|nr:hypothetical protein MONOS_18370 [Monocercomonoides exilis]